MSARINCGKLKLRARVSRRRFNRKEKKSCSLGGGRMRSCGAILYLGPGLRFSRMMGGFGGGSVSWDWANCHYRGGG